MGLYLQKFWYICKLFFFFLFNTEKDLHLEEDEQLARALQASMNVEPPPLQNGNSYNPYVYSSGYRLFFLFLFFIYLFYTFPPLEIKLKTGCIVLLHTLQSNIRNSGLLRNTWRKCKTVIDIRKGPVALVFA